MRKADSVGDSRGAFKVVAALRGKRTGGSSLEGTDPALWVGHFDALLGTPKPPREKASADMQQMESWNVCQEWLEAGCDEASVWRCDMDLPSNDEVKKTVLASKKNKAVSGIIPTEFFANSEIGLSVLASMVRRVWRGEEIPQEWLDAALCLLYKGKGSRADPNAFRGISLLSAAEKVMSIIILNRVKEPLEERLLSMQSGFRRGRSCKDASFVLCRELERAIKFGSQKIFDFVDFSKAFDSLDWATMWEILSYQGMPM